jgi:uncharacterized protein YukE
MRIRGNPEAVAAAAGDLGGVTSRLHSDETSIDNTAHALTAPGHWDAQAATAFAGAVVKLDDEIERLAGACHAAQGALSWYAGELSRLQSQVSQLNQDAAAAHVSIDDEGTARYNGPPILTPAGAPGPAQPFQQRARQLLGQADSIAHTARQRIDQARMSLVERYHLAPPWSTPWGTGNLVHAAYTGAASAYSMAKLRFDPLQQDRNRLQWKLDGASSPKKARHWQKLLQRFDREHGTALSNSEDAMNAADRWANRLPGSKVLGLSVSDLAADSRILGSPVLRNVPVVGAVMTAGQSAWEIGHGAEPTETITANTTSLVAGSIAADVAIGGAIALGMAGAAPIVVGVVVGGLVAWGVGEGVHAFFHTEVGRDVANAVDHAAEATVDAVGDAGKAVGHAVSDTWHSIFG